MTSSSTLRLAIEKILALLEPGGPIALHLPGFEARQQQKQLLHSIVEAYNHNKIALVEAGTGTGKSLSYLIPAILWALQNKTKTLISTNTIALQEQLLHKDIPFLVKALNVDIKAVLVKGMSNYVCLRKLHETMHEIPLFTETELKEQQIIDAWAEKAEAGSKNDLPIYPSNTTWERIRADSDACTHNNCPHFKNCFFFKARKEAQEANILIANHHMLLADLKVKHEAKGKEAQLTGLMPDYHYAILDEAHNLEEIASDFFAKTFSRAELVKLMGRLSSEKSLTGNSKLALLRKKLQEAIGNNPQINLGPLLNLFNIDIPTARREIIAQTALLGEALESFILQTKPQELEQAQPENQENKLRLKEEQYRHLGWQEGVLPAILKLSESLKSFHATLNALEKEIVDLQHQQVEQQTKAIRFEINNLLDRLSKCENVLTQFSNEKIEDDRVRWLEIVNNYGHNNISLVEADLDISSYLLELLFRPLHAVILCSATLTTNQSFQFCRSRLGLNHPSVTKRITELILDSPFDYKKQSLFAVPTDISEPKEELFDLQAAENILQAIQTSRGGVFVLFTSYQQLKNCHEQIKAQLAAENYQVFLQGSDHRQALLTKFREAKNGILFGTSSFWEGVDVVGESLRCVILVKLPFKVPSEPLLAARCEKIKKEGGNYFREYLLPQAIVKFKQGFGRLIRNKKDRGCIICLDVRLMNKHYGRDFINSLPACQVVTASSHQLMKEMKDFYRKTFYLTK